MMKRAIGILLCCVLALSMSACANAQEMYIEVAQLTDSEKDIAELLGLNQQYSIFDFHVDGTVKSMQVNAYELIDGAWNPIVGGGEQEITDRKGRIALGYGMMPEGLRIAVQMNHQNTAISYSREAEPHLEELAAMSARLSHREEITCEQEIPLAIQAILPNDAGIAMSLDSYFHPEEFAGQDDVRVYAITVLFSQKPAGELSE